MPTTAAVAEHVKAGSAPPAAAMALCRLDVPGLVLYSGTIAPGHHRRRDITLQEVFEAVGVHAAGSIDDVELAAVEDRRVRGAGAWGGQFTANTMSTTMEFLGLSPAVANDPATHPTRPPPPPRPARSAPAW